MGDQGNLLTLESVEREIAGRFRWMRFAPALERHYETDQFPQRMRSMTYCSIIAVFIYNAFLISDWIMVPDVFTELCISRVCIFTPLVIIAFFSLRRWPSPHRLELFWTTMEVVGSFLMMRVIAKSSSLYVPDYSYGIVLIMLYTCMVQRPPILYATIGCIAMFAIQIWALACSSRIDHVMFRANVEFFVSATVLLLVGCYSLEREKRLGFLLAMRGGMLNARLERIANIDPLTGLWNRRHLSEVMPAAWAQAVGKRETAMAVILLDVDHFKSFNDAYGHVQGDVCLRRIAGALGDVCTGASGEIVVRFGGEEFLIFLPGVSEAAAVGVAERLRQAVRAAAVPHPIIAADAVVTASFGVAGCISSDATPDMLILAADNTLYRAKAEGRDRVRSSQDLTTISRMSYAGAA